MTFRVEATGGERRLLHMGEAISMSHACTILSIAHHREDIEIKETQDQQGK